MFLASPARAEDASLPFDHSEWDQFLKKFVSENSEVNYRAVQKDPALLNAYLEKLKSFDALTMKMWPREEQIALWINAYNAGVIKTIVDHYPLKSVNSIPGGWEQALVQVGRSSKVSTEDAATTRSLNQIEDFYLRKGFRDEKIIFAICRGARGSPKLRREAYTGRRLEGQLYLAVREFVNDSKRNQIEPAEKKVILAHLFRWYASDFLLNWSNFPEETSWSPQEMAVLSFLAHYLDDPKKVDFLRNGKYKVKYDTFDWRLNDWTPSESKT